MYSNAITEFNANPNPEFADSLMRQYTEVVQDADDPSSYSFQQVKGTQVSGTQLNGDLRDIFNNQFTDDGRLVCDKLEASGNSAVADKTLTNNLKTFWYISIKPLPDIIKNNPRV